jgi:hypothetical protein
MNIVTMINGSYQQLSSRCLHPVNFDFNKHLFSGR